MTRSWYAFVQGENPLSEKSYIRVGIKPTCLCGNIICAISVASTEDYLKEPLSANLQKYIQRALATEYLQPESPYNAKIYVYLRDI